MILIAKDIKNVKRDSFLLKLLEENSGHRMIETRNGKCH